MESRTELKQAAKERLAAEKAAKLQRKTELQAMTPADRKAAKSADREAARAARRAEKSEAKAARASMSRAERREARRAERAYRRLKARPRRIAGWSVAVAVLAIVGIVAAPVIADVNRLLSVKVDSSTADGVAARAYATGLAEDISDEGIVLLKNDNDVLPLAEQAVNVFGFDSFNLRFGGGGSGAGDQSTAVGLYEALEEQGIATNPELKAAMEAAGAKSKAGSSTGLIQVIGALTGGGGEAGEPAPDYLTGDVMAQASEFADTALVVLASSSVEASDAAPEQLALSGTQRQLLDTVTGSFENVVVVINAGNAMELGFLDEYPQITGALWIGTPGPRGAVSLAKILDGDVNPSGRLTDTYATDVASAPGTENFGDYDYANTKRSFLEYEEGIYVGYRYYETRFADDEEGYAAAVQFPFGHGLSYTSFDWQAAEPVVTDGTVSVDVVVTNTGQAAGKDVVQLYFSAPYTPGGIEKSAIELAGYAKTSLLEPGQSETVTIAYDVRDMSSWDGARGAYLLEAGNYGIAVSRDVHSPVAEFDTTVAADVVYDTDEATGVALESRFEDASGDLTFLSRDEWESTYPTTPDGDRTASAELLAEMYPEVIPAEGTAPTQGVDHGLRLEDLRGLDYDDAKWEDFLDQFTTDELIKVFANGGYQTAEIERLGVPSGVLLDGPAGLNFFFGDITAASFPTEVVIASTWNTDLARAMGEAIGAEANAYGVQGWYAPGMNLHRTALGGRNFEYYSEDPVVSGTMGAAMVAGAQSTGLITFMKHFALNEQEINARSGVHVWADEQAIRELYLRPFEITVKDGGANGAMSSFVHVGARWSGGNEALLEDVLRGEWGFQGVVSSDAVLGAFMDPGQAIIAGNDLMLAVLPSVTESAARNALAADPVGIGGGLRDRVHAVMFALLHTDLFD
ncbi:glycoside hydrolase family 3 protein [Microterricola viridarii]|uniref:Fibronectin type III-like domain-containing protein n=1 Tax=Microterricola viridarii TaxID=412690 RepID=A0A109QXE5_9MICO|nr:glycoside hydrolase family 3 protein [Microterricola viridarii]AMB59853.1 hypothetical protein AWU67_14405 [Microterricola viridarii]